MGGIIPARAGFTARRAPPPRGGRDHPRSRGVYITRRSIRIINGGSSPLARGLRAEDHGRSGRGGIIPARAGFTCGSQGAAGRGWDHPRSRGVYKRATTTPSPPSGSSPLARGLPAPDDDCQARLGIIPARAGFTGTSPAVTGRRRDHPRSRGVYRSLHTLSHAGWGSSPLARGLPHRTRVGDRARGDHPRSRGVYERGPGRPGPAAGSSPLARGLRLPRRQGGGGWGIIPARAGFTDPGHSEGRELVDHPRSRGVYCPCPASTGSGRGSSPLARGLRKEDPWQPVPPGIIPARAGFTRGWIRGRHRASDHPRSRGVYTAFDGMRRATIGSSPLARGLLQAYVAPVLSAGIIPARAGFTSWVGEDGAMSGDHPRSRGVYRVQGVDDALDEGSSPLARGLPLFG